ncbi:methyltransferase domain-containing protein [Pseudalkalibacillus hwajinpoensis]|uniref:class I SAM-dependent methyltransferase n=1 Tax=Guptibacillus hwajinpoensis TaxID=208199 RepID=UPI00325A5EA2
MLKNQLKHLENGTIRLPQTQVSRLKWCGSRASGFHLLQVSQTPSILALINEDPELDMVNVFPSNQQYTTIDHPAVESCCSVFWTGDLSGAIPYPTNYFDTVIIDELLELTAQEAIDEFRRVVKPNGKLIITQELTKSLTRKDYWIPLLSHFEELDKRLDNDCVSWVGRNSGVDLTETEDIVEHLVVEISERLEEKKIFVEEKKQQVLKQKKDSILEQLEKDKKLKMTVPYFRNKYLTQIETIQLTEKEKSELTPLKQDTVLHTQKIELKELILQSFQERDIAIVMGDGDYYRKYSLNFSHHLTEALLRKGYRVIYVTNNVDKTIHPIKNESTQLLQINRKDFGEIADLFNQPALFITSTDLQIAKRIGRFLWNRWSVYYLPEAVIEQNEDVHSFLANLLKKENFLAGAGSKFPISAVVKERVPTYTKSSESTKLILGFIGDLSTKAIHYQAIKELLRANEALTVELIGHHLPEEKPFRTNRLIMREYTHREEVAKRIQKWTGGILPVKHPEDKAPINLMQTTGMPLLKIEDWSAPLDPSLLIPSENPRNWTEVLDEILSNPTGGLT